MDEMYGHKNVKGHDDLDKTGSKVIGHHHEYYDKNDKPADSEFAANDYAENFNPKKV
jgi:hypothetical protein